MTVEWVIEIEMSMDDEKRGNCYKANDLFIYRGTIAGVYGTELRQKPMLLVVLNDRSLRSVQAWQVRVV